MPGPFGPPSHLRAAGERIALRGGKSAKKRAVIAVALQRIDAAVPASNRVSASALLRGHLHRRGP